MSEQVATRNVAYAVICTGVVTPDSDVLPFKMGNGERVPVILFLDTSREKCERMKKRLKTRIGRVESINMDNTVATDPILGVVEVECDRPLKRAKVAVAASENGEVADTSPKGRKAKSR